MPAALYPDEAPPVRDYLSEEEMRAAHDRERQLLAEQRKALEVKHAYEREQLEQQLQQLESRSATPPSPQLLRSTPLPTSQSISERTPTPLTPRHPCPTR